MAKDYDKILTRLVFTLTKLSNDERPTIVELSDEFNVSVKTIQRDIYQRLMLFPIQKDDNGGLMFEDGFSLNQSKFSIDEIITISLSLDQIKDAGNEFNQNIEQLSSKLIYPELFNPYYIKPQLHQTIDMDSPLLNKIEDAIEEKRVCEVITHKGLEKLKVLKIVNFDGIWYLLTKEFEKNKIKTIFLDDIVDINYLDVYTKLDENIESLLESKIQSAHFKDGVEFDVVIKVDKKISQYFKLKKHLPSQKIIDTHNDGTIVVKFQVSHDEDVDNLIKSWLPDIEIVEPIRLRDKVISELQDYLNRLCS